MRQLLAEGILAWEDSLCEGLIDDRDLGLRLVVGFLESSAPQQAGAERSEIGGADVPVGGSFIAGSGGLTFTPVAAPEPSSVALMLLGVGLVFVLRKRHQLAA